MTTKPSWGDMVEEEERQQKEKEKEKEKKGETGLEKDIAKLGTAPSGNEEDDGKQSQRMHCLSSS